MPYTVGDIVLVPFPFTNLASAKARPALVVSVTTHNENDVVLVAISSTGTSDSLSVDVRTSSESFRGTGLRVDSVIRAGKLLTIEQSLIYRTIGRASAELMAEVRSRLAVLFGL